MAPNRQASTKELDMLEQYRSIKTKYQDAILLFRFGDFYEMFEQDAELAARDLHLVLTSRSLGRGGERVPMCGIPHFRLETYVARLVGKGHKVAICEQLEEAKPGRGLIRRDVIRVVTPGTHFEFGDGEGALAALLPPACGGDDRGGRFGFALLQLSTGEFLAAEADAVELPSLFARFRPKEVLLPEGGEAALKELCPWLSTTSFITKRPQAAFAPEQALSVLAAHFGAPSSEWGMQNGGCRMLKSAIRIPKSEFPQGGRGGWGFSFHDGDLGLLAAGALLAYAKETQMGFFPHVKAPRPYRGKDYVFLDPHTQRNLELIEGALEGVGREAALLEGGSRPGGAERKIEGSLLAVLDRTLTGMGRRRLKAWILHPLLSLEEIRRRQDAVEELVRKPGMRSRVRELLAKVFDLERLTSRITSEIAKPRDLISLKVSLLPLPQLRRLLGEMEAPLLQALHEILDPLEEVRDKIERVLLDEPKITAKEGGLIRDGVSKELDALREVQRSGHQWLSRFEAKERERTGIPNLKVGFNKVFGYYIEVTKSQLKSVPPDYIRRQTLTGGERFVTQKLQEFEGKVLSAAEKANQLEYQLFCELRAWTASQADRLRRTAEALGVLDTLASLAEVAAKKGWVRPQVDEGYEIQIQEGRHPVVETQGAALSEAKGGFVPNDLHLDETRHLLIVTGPNASGKSTFVRQAALLVLLAQIGSFVPAEKAKVSLIDRIFTRIGAADALARGLSTFMVEMMETAHILRNATERSLVILDEVGRGTGTLDGMAIAQAVVEELARRKAKTLFTTHYHELAHLATKIEGIANARLEVREEEGEVAFLYKVVPGVSQKSYGIHVAKLAGLPDPVIWRAQALLQEHEGRNAQGKGAGGGEWVVGKPKYGRVLNPPLHPPLPTPLEERLLQVDPIRTTPFDALLLLAELKELAARSTLEPIPPSPLLSTRGKG